MNNPLPQRKLSQRSGSVIPLISVSFIAMAILGGGIYWFFSSATGEADIDPILATVDRGEFVAKVLDQGEIQSAENVEIKCSVGSRNGNITVIDVIAEGTIVNEGDWLVTLDGTSFEKELEQQRIKVSNAETSVIQAKAAYEAAVASKNEYIQGIFVEREKQIENEEFEATQNLEEAEAFLRHSVKLQKKGFITKQQLRSDEIAVAKFRNSLELAQKKLEVLRKITYPKEIALLESDIAATKVKWDNEVDSQQIEQNQLDEIKEQLKNCTINVPEGVSGEVVFAKEYDRRGGSEWVLEPGASVRERQALIRLPNRDKMEVKVLVNEQSITAIRPNMPASIIVDAMTGQTLKGFVTKVNSYAEQGSWMSSSNVREYAAFVRIIDPPANLIPGMNASVTIQTMYEADAVQAPLQCIYAVNDEQYVLRKNGGKFETVLVTIGGENSQNIWLTSGVDAGDELVMNPGAYKSLMDLPELAGETRIEIPEGTAMTSETEDAGYPKQGGGEQRGEMSRGGQKGRDGKGETRGGRDGKSDRKGRGERGGGGGFGGNPEQMMNSFIERLDQDSDGKISSEEWNSSDNRMASMMDDPDTNGDGEVTREELTKAFEKLRSRFQGGGGGGVGGRGGN